MNFKIPLQARIRKLTVEGPNWVIYEVGLRGVTEIIDDSRVFDTSIEFIFHIRKDNSWITIINVPVQIKRFNSIE